MNIRYGFMVGILCCTVLMSSGCGSVNSGRDTAGGVSFTADRGNEDICISSEISIVSQNDCARAGNLNVVAAPGKTAASTTAVAAGNPVVAKKSVLDGKKVSILGDSISTFTGYIPADYSIFYPENGGITKVTDTWWMRVINGTHAVYCADASYSGSETCGLSTEMKDGRPGVGYRRLKDLTAANGTKPDVVLVYMGANDLLDSRPLGTNNGTKPVQEGNIGNFSDAYSLMLDKIRVLYPNTQIYCLTFHEICRWNDAGVGYTFKSNIGLVSSQYNDRIKVIAKNKGIPVIDVFNDCGIKPATSKVLTIDGTHPNAQGAAQIANSIIRDLDAENK